MTAAIPMVAIVGDIRIFWWDVAFMPICRKHGLRSGQAIRRFLSAKLGQPSGRSSSVKPLLTDGGKPTRPNPAVVISSDKPTSLPAGDVIDTADGFKMRWVIACT